MKLKTLLRAPLLWLLVFFLMIYAVTSAWTEAPALLLFQNAVLAALSIGVVIAYAPEAFRALMSPRPTQGDLLSFGIFIAWLGTGGVRFLGVLRYGLDQPQLFGSDWSTFAAFTIGVAAMCHLAAPEAINGWLPRRYYVQVGAWIAAGLVAVVIIITLRVHWALIETMF